MITFTKNKQSSWRDFMPKQPITLELALSEPIEERLFSDTNEDVIEPTVQYRTNCSELNVHSDL